MKTRLSLVYCASMMCVGLCFGAQGPAALALAEQCGIVSNALTGEGTATHPRDVSRLGEMGVATSLDAIAGIFGTLLGAWLVDNIRSWHRVLLVYLLWQGAAFTSWTVVRSFPQLIVASVSWGFASTMPSLSTQAALTWIWGPAVAPWMHVNNAAFGLGSLVSPSLVSWELGQRQSFHYAYYAIGLANLGAAFLTLPFPTPRPAASDSPDPATGPGVELRVIATGSGPLVVDAQALPLTGCAGRILAAIDIDTSCRSKWLPLLKMWLIFYLWFFVYVASESGFSSWVSPYATLSGLASEADAALLTSTYVISAQFSRISNKIIKNMRNLPLISSIFSIEIQDLG